MKRGVSDSGSIRLCRSHHQHGPFVERNDIWALCYVGEGYIHRSSAKDGYGGKFNPDPEGMHVYLLCMKGLSLYECAYDQWFEYEEKICRSGINPRGLLPKWLQLARESPFVAITLPGFMCKKRTLATKISVKTKKN